MKTFKEFEPYVNVETKQKLFHAKELSARAKYDYGIDFYENKYGSVRYYAIVTRNNVLLDWNSFAEYNNAMKFIITYLQ